MTHLLNHSYRYESQEQALQSKITGLEKELSHANDLLAAMKQRGLHESDVLSLSPAAAKASSLLKSGLSLTQIYSQYVEVCEELGREKEETDRLNNYLEQINQELEEKTPALQKVRERGRGGKREGWEERGRGGKREGWEERGRGAEVHVSNLRGSFRTCTKRWCVWSWGSLGSFTYNFRLSLCSCVATMTRHCRTVNSYRRS